MRAQSGWGLVIRTWPRLPTSLSSRIAPSSSCCPHHPRCPLQILQKGPWSPSDASFTRKCHLVAPVGGLLAGLAFKTHKLIPPLALGLVAPCLLPSLTPSSQARSGSAPCYLHSQNRLYLAAAAKYRLASVEYSWLGKWSWAGNGTKAAPAVGLKEGRKNLVLPGQ